MEKIYRLRQIAHDLARKRGHIFPFRYNREFQMDRGALIKILWGNCILCGSWMRITDHPFKDGDKEMTGPALEFNCKKGEVPVEPMAPVKNVFAGNFRQEFSDKTERKNKKAQSRFGI